MVSYSTVEYSMVLPVATCWVSQLAEYVLTQASAARQAAQVLQGTKLLRNHQLLRCI